MDGMKLRAGGCADPAALNPLAMFKEADHQGSIEIAFPDHLKLALDGALPAVKQKSHWIVPKSCVNSRT
jgi:hypothetical protein